MIRTLPGHALKTKPGDAVLRDGVEIGTYTSVLGTQALAKLKRSAVTD